MKIERLQGVGFLDGEAQFKDDYLVVYMRLKDIIQN
jgi:hypothetical protein